MALLPLPDETTSYVGGQEKGQRPTKDFYNWLKSFRDVFAATQAPWTAFTPTLSAAAGTYTSASASGRILQSGKMVLLQLKISIVTVGTGTFPVASLPIAGVSGVEYVMAGRETALTGKMVYGSVGAISNTSLFVSFYDATSPAASGAAIQLSGVYEAA